MLVKHKALQLNKKKLSYFTCMFQCNSNLLLQIQLKSEIWKQKLKQPLHSLTRRHLQCMRLPRLKTYQGQVKAHKQGCIIHIAVHRNLNLYFKVLIQPGSFKACVRYKIILKASNNKRQKHVLNHYLRQYLSSLFLRGVVCS